MEFSKLDRVKRSLDEYMAGGVDFQVEVDPKKKPKSEVSKQLYKKLRDMGFSSHAANTLTAGGSKQALKHLSKIL